jgi:hypothetical protein
MKQYKPSIIAVACIVCSRSLNEIKPAFPAALQEMTKVSAADIQDCKTLLFEYYQTTFSKYQKVKSPETVHLPSISSNNTSMEQQVSEFKADVKLGKLVKDRPKPVVNFRALKLGGINPFKVAKKAFSQIKATSRNETTLPHLTKKENISHADMRETSTH